MGGRVFNGKPEPGRKKASTITQYVSPTSGYKNLQGKMTKLEYKVSILPDKFNRRPVIVLVCP